MSELEKELNVEDQEKRQLVSEREQLQVRLWLIIACLSRSQPLRSLTDDVRCDFSTTDVMQRANQQKCRAGKTIMGGTERGDTIAGHAGEGRQGAIAIQAGE